MSVRIELEVFDRADDLQQLGQRNIEVVEKPPDGFNPEVERQHARINSLLQGIAVDAGKNMLRLGRQISRGQVTGIVRSLRIKVAVGDEVLKDLVHQIDI